MHKTSCTIIVLLLRFDCLLIPIWMQSSIVSALLLITKLSVGPCTHSEMQIINCSTLLFTTINTIYIKKDSSLSTVVRPTMTHIKQQQYFWHPTSRGHTVLLTTQFAHSLTCEFLLKIIGLPNLRFFWNTFKSTWLMQHPTTIPGLR